MYIIYISLIYYFISVLYSIFYIKYIYNNNDNGGGWATDFLLGINAFTFILSNYFIYYSKFFILCVYI